MEDHLKVGLPFLTQKLEIIFEITLTVKKNIYMCVHAYICFKGSHNNFIAHQYFGARGYKKKKVL